MPVIFQPRHETAANWTADNPTLVSGEMGLEEDTGKVKWNRSASGVAWNSLAYYTTNNNSTPISGTGDVVGPSSSVASELALFDGTTGKLIKRATTTGLLKGASGVLSAATSGTDYSAGTSALATGIVKSTTTTGALTIATSGTDYAPATSGSAILKGNGSGGFSSAAAGTDYIGATSGSAIQKANGSGGLTAATAGTDYAAVMFNAQLTSTQSVSNTGTDTTLWTPANFAAGSLAANVTLFRVRLGGNFDNQATSGLFDAKLKINTTTVATIPIIGTSITGAQTVQPWWADLDVYVDATGAGGAVTVVGTSVVQTTAGGGINPRAVATTTSVNLTAGAQFTWTGDWVTASVTNVFRTFRGNILQVS